MMMNNSFHTTVELTKPCREIFRAITTDVSKWWGGKDLSGSSEKIGDEFIILHPGAHYSKQKLIELIPEKKLVWLVTESNLQWLIRDPEDWTGTKMIFELTEKSGNTMLHFTHEGLTPEKESFEECSMGWDMAIHDWLFNFIEKGRAHF